MASSTTVVSATLGPIHSFFYKLPSDCTVLHVFVIGRGHGLSLFFRDTERGSSFVMPLFEGLQSVCTGGKSFNLSTWWTGGCALHSYEWIPHRFPSGHFVLRFVYREVYNLSIPPLSDYCWTVVKGNLLTTALPLPMQRADPVGINRHGVFYTEDILLNTRIPTCNPRTCEYRAWEMARLM